jgi:hypothetical protein
MATFEQQVIGEIPLHEAASFFVGMKSFPTQGQTKTAAKSPVQQTIEKLVAGDMPEGKAGRNKTAQVKEALSPRPISKAVARGAELLSGNKAKLLREAADETLGRAATQMAPIRGEMPNVRALRDSGYSKSGLRMKGDSTSRSLRPMPGGPALKASKKLEGMADEEAKSVSRARTVAAGVGGAALGAGAGELSRKMKQAAAKLGFGISSPAGAGDPEANMEGGQPTPAASNLPAAPGAAPMAPPSGPIQDPEAAKPSTEQTVPVNYMGAELLAQAAQRANETGFLRERLNAATQQNNALNQQLQSIQGQLDQVNTTQQAAGDQIMQATNEAVAASTRALEHSMAAANMRIGIQKMREAMMELASQDPESMGTLAQQQQAQDESVEQQAVNGAAGAPGQSPTPPTQPGSPAAEAPEQGGSEGSATGDSGGSAASKGTSVNIKTSSPAAGLVGGLAGAGLGGLMGHRRAQGVDEAQQEVGDLSGQQDGSFGKALDLAKAKQRLASNELAAAHPTRSVVGGALKGGIGGAVIGSGLHQLGQTLKSQLG